jgi:hypothetical protein
MLNVIYLFMEDCFLICRHSWTEAVHQDGSRKDSKRPAQRYTDKRMREPKRGLGIAMLEKMRLE